MSRADYSQTPGRANREGEALAARPATKPQAPWRQELADAIDDVMVQRLTDGTRPDGYTGWERREAVRLLREWGLTYRQIAARLGIHDGQVWRDLRRCGYVNERRTA